MIGPWVWILGLFTALGLGIIFILDALGAVAAMGDYSVFLGLFLGAVALVATFWMVDRFNLWD